MSEEEKRRVAIATLVLLGAGAAYLLKDEILEEPEVKKEEKRKEEKKAEMERREEKPDATRGKEKKRKNDGYSNLTWDYFRRWLGSGYPGNDMRKIYPLLPEDFKMKWRRGIYHNGVRTDAEKAFIYYDAYFLGTRGYTELRNMVHLYASRVITFSEFLREYMRTLQKIFSGAKF